MSLDEPTARRIYRELEVAELYAMFHRDDEPPPPFDAERVLMRVCWSVVIRPNHEDPHTLPSNATPDELARLQETMDEWVAWFRQVVE